VREKAHRTLSNKLKSARYECLIAALHHWIAKGPWLQNGLALRSEHVDVFSLERLRLWRNGISKRGRHFGAVRRKQLHRLRIRCKRYRYILAALQMLGAVVEQKDLAFAETARKAHGTLGDLRDLKRFRKTARGRPPGYRKDNRNC
jgi:CHAD domain-containing protein